MFLSAFGSFIPAAEEATETLLTEETETEISERHLLSDVNFTIDTFDINQTVDHLNEYLKKWNCVSCWLKSMPADGRTIKRRAVVMLIFKPADVDGFLEDVANIEKIRDVACKYEASLPKAEETEEDLTELPVTGIGQATSFLLNYGKPSNVNIIIDLCEKFTKEEYEERSRQNRTDDSSVKSRLISRVVSMLIVCGVIGLIDWGRKCNR